MKKAELKGKPWFEITTDTNGQWHWCLWSSNGKIMSRNAQPIGTKRTAVQAVQNLQRLIVECKGKINSAFTNNQIQQTKAAEKEDEEPTEIIPY